MYDESTPPSIFLIGSAPKIAFDIGGVISKYPDEFRTLICALEASGFEIHIITDQPVKSEVLKQLNDNGFGFLRPELIHCANYSIYGEMCKAVLVHDLGIRFLVDDFAGYLAWDSSLGPAPIRLRVEPDVWRPYNHPNWLSSESFGRSCYVPEPINAG